MAPPRAARGITQSVFSKLNKDISRSLKTVWDMGDLEYELAEEECLIISVGNVEQLAETFLHVLWEFSLIQPFLGECNRAHGKASGDSRLAKIMPFG